jgi:hypothetical protein
VLPTKQAATTPAATVAVVATVTSTAGATASGTNTAVRTATGLAAAGDGSPPALDVTDPMLSSAGTASLTIAASASPAPSAAIVASPCTSDRPLALWAITLTRTATRGVVSLTTTTKATVPDGVGAVTMPVISGVDDPAVAGAGETVAALNGVEWALPLIGGRAASPQPHSRTIAAVAVDQ